MGGVGGGWYGKDTSGTHDEGDEKSTEGGDEHDYEGGGRRGGYNEEIEGG